jgi:hypothetical protein
MEEDWDDETPAWRQPHEAPFDAVLALKEIIPLAEFLSSGSPELVFDAIKTDVEVDGEFRFETLHVKGFESAYAKLCYHNGSLATIAVCHSDFDMPQIILHPPDLLHEA